MQNANETPEVSRLPPVASAPRSKRASRPMKARSRESAHRAKTVMRAKLFWCSTPDHDEDWFVVARSARAARSYHERAEGYARGDADVELVCDLPDGFDVRGAQWPTDEMLRACGAEIMRVDGSRVVRVGDRLFGEGNIVANVAARLGLVRGQ
jgi:hypothetical protein